MSKTLSFFDRLVVFLTGLLLLAAGLVPVAYYWEIPYVSEYLNRFDRESLGYVPDETWYRNALIAAFLVLLCSVRGSSWLISEAVPSAPATSLPRIPSTARARLTSPAWRLPRASSWKNPR